MGTAKPAQKAKTPQTAQQKHPTWIKHHTRRNVAITVLIVAVLVAIIIVASIPHPTVKVGQQAPSFSLSDVNGNGVFNLNSQRGKPVFVEFMRTTCEWCLKEAPLLSQAYANYSSRIVFVSVTIDPSYDQPSVLQAYARDHGMMTTGGQPWYLLRDDMSNTVTSQYGVNGTPTMFMIDTNGIVQQRLEGFTDTQPLKQAFQTIL